MNRKESRELLLSASENNVEVPGGRLGLEMVCVEPPRVREQIGCFLIQDDLTEEEQC